MGFFKGLLCLFLRLVWLLLKGVGFLLCIPGALFSFGSIIIFVVLLFREDGMSFFFKQYSIGVVTFFAMLAVGIVLLVLAEKLSDYIEKLKGEQEMSRFISRRTGYSGSSFNASKYVRSHCSDHIYGITSSADINRIKNDSSLTSQQRQQVLTEYQRQSDLYY